MQDELDELSREFGSRALHRQPAWADAAPGPVSMLEDDDDDVDGLLSSV